MHNNLLSGRQFWGSIVNLILCAAFISGCATVPMKEQLTVKDSDKRYDAGTIIETRSGRTITFEDLMADLHDVRIVYVGESHTDRAHHQVQLRIVKALAARDADLAVGMEMFDFTYQDVLDQWSAGLLNQEQFLAKTQWYANWRYDFDLYREILEFVQEQKLILVGLNIPFYVPSRIRVGGIENQQEVVKALLPENIDTSDPDHRAYLEEIYNSHQHRFKGSGNFDTFYEAQCVWEDTMAESIARNLGTGRMAVLVGNGHIVFKFGIPDRVYSRNGATFRTIYLAQAGSEVEMGYADYIWVTTPPTPPRR